MMVVSTLIRVKCSAKSIITRGLGFCAIWILKFLIQLSGLKA